MGLSFIKMSRNMHCRGLGSFHSVEHSLGTKGNLNHLSAVQVQQIDLVQLHWWDYETPGLADTMLVLADLQAQGHILSLGATNLDTRAIEMLTDADIKLVSNQVRLAGLICNLCDVSCLDFELSVS